MIRFKLTLSSGFVVEHLSYKMTDAIEYVENWYKTTVIKCEMVWTNEKNEKTPE